MNELSKETSPYLLQHANNPVHWRAWNDETLRVAKQENKMLLISVGYAACHWCHVMEHECFEDEEVAELMNRYFVCVKVDREERPDVDQLYMNAAYLINGSGGWPLNALATPGGKPFFAGTFFPKSKWMQLLEYFGHIYQTEPDRIVDQAEKLAKGISQIENIPLNDGALAFRMEDVANMFTTIYAKADLENGGMASRMKFPMPAIWEFVLHYHYLSGDDRAFQIFSKTLDRMATGGIYDQVGGGFARYATDAEWHVPHFEKMLYDNSQLVKLYSHAFQVTKNNFYRNVVTQTLEFVSRELTSPEGVFYSSLDADSEGEEGKYYVWSRREIGEVLGNDSEKYCEYYGITDDGNWEQDKNIPDLNFGNSSISTELPDVILECNKKLLERRESRMAPGLDDKILTSWNALMISGYVAAFKAFSQQAYLKAAMAAAEFIFTHCYVKERGLYRNFKNGNATIHAFLDDYAFLITAFINLYQVTFDENYLYRAKQLAEETIANFYDEVSGMFFYTDSRYSNLIMRKMEVTDNVIPSSISQMAHNLYLLGLYFENEEMISMSEQVIKNIFKDAAASPPYHANYIRLMLLQLYSPFETVVTGKNWQDILGDLQKNYFPQTIYSGGEIDSALPLLQQKIGVSDPTIYVCRDKTCQLPVHTAEEAVTQMKI